MASTILPRLFLQTRITWATLAIFVLSLWPLSFFASRLLRQDTERLLGEQQFSIRRKTASMRSVWQSSIPTRSS